MNKVSLDIYYRKNTEARGVTDDTKIVKKYKKRLSGKTLTETDEEFWEYILILLKTSGEYTPKERNQIVEDITEYYYFQTGITIRAEMLSALADFLLSDTLSDTKSNKVRKAEFPILGFGQLDRRRSKEKSMDEVKIDYFASKREYKIATKKFAGEQVKQKGENN